ncbi:DivIVA domain-containing protein [Thermovibrio sp.]
MKKHFTPSEIRNKEFSKKLWGYNPEEVESFLIEVASSYGELLREIERLRVKTPEYKAKEIIEKTKKEIEKIVEKKREEIKQIEKRKEEIEFEIEKLKLAQKNIYDRLKVAIIEMTRILEELRRDVGGKEERRGSGNRVESSAQVVKEQDREGGRGETEGEGDGSSRRGESQ